MRTIKFRGKRTDGGGWIIGYYVKELNPYIKDTEEIDAIITKAGDYEVLPESVGQWTGLVDKNGVEIFEGDVIYGENYLFPVYDFRKMAVTWNEKSGGFDMDIFDQENIEVIGNLIDSPELMEVE